MAFFAGIQIRKQTVCFEINRQLIEYPHLFHVKVKQLNIRIFDTSSKINSFYREIGATLLLQFLLEKKSEPCKNFICSNTLSEDN